ncbi:unnamed protein product [Oikopleura dioica]|uniref:BtpA family membrane complex biogenesis protein n=1 Tax=Oikopleura dioica TaxID=34765 RepID=E4Y0K2_OIKDI|nr:unnamed protein product [Oikopleura dioica]
MQRPLIFGMVHLRALPGAPRNKLSVREIADKALREADSLLKNGVDGLIIENMHDVPYQRPEHRSPEVTAVIETVSIRAQFPTVTAGVQVLSCGNKEALSIALAADLDFIRCESFVFGHMGDEGFAQSDAAELLRFRRNIGAENVKIFTDIKKKHSSHALTGDLSIADVAVAADFFLTDGLIVTGQHTGTPVNKNDITQIRAAVNQKVFIGSGTSVRNILDYSESVDGFIIGSEFKQHGYWENEIDESRVKEITSLLAAQY